MITIHTVAADEFSTMDDDALAAAVSTHAAHIHAATGRLLVLIAELDRREVWAGGVVLRPLAELGLWHRYAYRSGEGARRPRPDRAAAALRGAGQG